MLSRSRHQQAKPPVSRDKITWPAPDASPHMGAPLAWGIALAAVATIFAIVAIIANYGALNRQSEEQVFQAGLSPSRYDAIGALIAAAGEPCSKVCTIRREPSLSSPNLIDVTCARSTSPRSCAAPVRYAVTVSRRD